MGEPESPNNKHRKLIETTALDVLKTADLETATELDIRTATAARLGVDRFDLDQKRLIRTVLESFLLSTTTTTNGTTKSAQGTTNNNGSCNEVQQSEAAKTPIDNNVVRECEAIKATEGRINNNGVQHIEATYTAINDGVQQIEAEAKNDIVLGLGVDQEGNENGGADYIQSNNSNNNNDNNSRIICQLSSTRYVTVNDIGGQSTVTIQDYHQKDGKQFPKSGGTSFTAEQWVSMKNNIPAIEEAITRMKSRLRLRIAGKPSEPAVSRLVVDSAQANATGDSKRVGIADLQESNFERSEQMELNSNASTPNPLHHTAPNSVHNPTISLPPPGLMHMPVRLDGTNYYLWKHQMEFSLAELKVVYVLTEACPSFSSTSSGTREEIDETKALIQKWVDDDYICCHNILTCLSDNLYNDYSRKACSAKELWEELKSVYDEDIGTKRSQVNKYVQFQIVDGVSILEQVHELQSIAHSICASGIWIEEYFHVSFIISKLPPSWKEFRMRMMREEFLPLHMLMHRLKVEEDARNGKQPGKPSGHGVGSKCDARVGSHGKEMKKYCYNCKKSGHISKHCRDRKKEVPNNGPTKENGHCLKGHSHQG